MERGVSVPTVGKSEGVGEVCASGVDVCGIEVVGGSSGDSTTGSLPIAGSSAVNSGDSAVTTRVSIFPTFHFASC